MGMQSCKAGGFDGRRPGKSRTLDRPNDGWLKYMMEKAGSTQARFAPAAPDMFPDMIGADP